MARLAAAEKAVDTQKKRRTEASRRRTGARKYPGDEGALRMGRSVTAWRFRWGCEHGVQDQGSGAVRQQSLTRCSTQVVVQ